MAAPSQAIRTATKCWIHAHVEGLRRGPLFVLQCQEWAARGGVNHVCQPEHVATPAHQVRMPLWLGDAALHKTHQSALLSKLPSHYAQFGWNINHPKVEYLWPHPVRNDTDGEITSYRLCRAGERNGSTPPFSPVVPKTTKGRTTNPQAQNSTTITTLQRNSRKRGSVAKTILVQEVHGASVVSSALSSTPKRCPRVTTPPRHLPPPRRQPLRRSPRLVLASNN